MKISIRIILFSVIFLGTVGFAKEVKREHNLFAYVASTEEWRTKITKISLENLETVKQKEICLGYPGMIEIDTANRYLFISVGGMSEYPVYKVNTKSLEVESLLREEEWKEKDIEDKYPGALKLSPDGNILYGRGYEIDSKEMKILRRMPSFLMKFHGYGDSYIFPEGNRAISYEPVMGGEIRIIDLSEGKEIKRIWFWSEGIGNEKYIKMLNDSLKILTKGRMQISPNGKCFYASNLPYHYYKWGKNIKVFNTSTGEIVNSIPFPIEFTSKNKLTKLIEIDSFFERYKNSVGKKGYMYPRSDYGEISVSPDGKYIFWPVGTGDFAEGYVVIIDTKSKKVIKRIPIGGGHITNVVFGYE
ncbi:hypothetical protein KAW48_10725 [candidate division WOR-3 bacterium]|nr:hypothetical protein [candidate division WOR-3 bacterium]